MILPTQTSASKEGVPTYYAGFWWRFLASSLDGLFFVAIIFVTQFIIEMRFFQMAGHSASGGASFFLIGLALSLLPNWLYYAGFESSKHQATPGKMACRLIVTDIQGNRITFARATGRFFAKYVSALILYIGYLMVCWTKRKQGLHDMMASTLVLRQIRKTS